MSHIHRLLPRHRSTRLLLIVALLALGIAGGYTSRQASAATETANVWIVASGGSASCVRQATPVALASAPANAKCSTAQAAFTAMSGGDTGIMTSGTYSNLNIQSGSKTSMVTIKVETGGTVHVGSATIFNMNNLTLDGTAGANGQGFDTTSGITIGSNGGAPAQNLTINGYKIHNAGGGAVVYMTGCSKVNISNLEIADIQNADGIQMANFTGQPQCTDVTFDHIYIHDFTATCGVDHQDGTQFRSGTRIVFKNSRIYNLKNCGSQGFFANQEGDLGGSDTTLQNTVIAGINGNAINFSSKGPQKMINNTIIGGLNTCQPRTSTCSGVIMKNNILDTSCAGLNLYYSRSDNPSTDWSSNITPSSCGKSGDYSTSGFNNMFVNATTSGLASNQYDFHLRAGSFAIGKAEKSSAPATDLEGNARDSAPDAGAYEYGATTPPPPPPTGGGIYDAQDLTAVLTHYGVKSGASTATGDLNNDGAVNVYDLGILLSSYSG